RRGEGRRGRAVRPPWNLDQERRLTHANDVSVLQPERLCDSFSVHECPVRRAEVGDLEPVLEGTDDRVAARDLAIVEREIRRFASDRELVLDFEPLSSQVSPSHYHRWPVLPAVPGGVLAGR